MLGKRDQKYPNRAVKNTLIEQSDQWHAQNKDTEEGTVNLSMKLPDTCMMSECGMNITQVLKNLTSTVQKVQEGSALGTIHSLILLSCLQWYN